MPSHSVAIHYSPSLIPYSIDLALCHTNLTHMLSSMFNVKVCSQSSQGLHQSAKVGIQQKQKNVLSKTLIEWSHIEGLCGT